MNNNVAVIGSLFGDEAKARCVHYFSPQFDYICKFNGSNNAGHTIYSNNKKYVFNQVPSIDFTHSHTKGFLGSGMVINIEALRDELLTLEQDFPGISNRITIDPDAFIVLPKHIVEDQAKNSHIGTTNKGVGPAYSDKVSRTGIKVSYLLEEKTQIIKSLFDMGVKFQYVLELYDKLKSSKVLFEGAQGVLLDLNAGTYPYVSCGDSTLSGIYSSGFGFIAPSTVYGVAKVYSTKVGTGPFPTEYFGDEADQLRNKGQEYGSVTGRPRRVGALDLPALRYAKKKSGLTHLILTKFDVLNNQKIKICHKYKNEPMSGRDFFSAVPEYIEMDGWTDAHDFEQIKEFIKFVQGETGLKVSYISCGVNPEDFIQC